ncbi:MAG: hypothetical protein IKM65_03175, partial [Bacteroidaceae bacterium]|nr:hypothetical protein [Bacteroidaceae bacterium]
MQQVSMILLFSAPLYYKKEERFLGVLIVKSVIIAPLSTKRSRRVASEEFDCVYKYCCLWLFLTPHPAGELLFITKKRSAFFGCLKSV